MSNITIQFGQCGNQIGQTFYECIYEDIKAKNESNKILNKEYTIEAINQWFHIKPNGLEARCILIDTEEKVTSLANKKKPYTFKNIISNSYGGSANNWAFGYTSRSSLVTKDVMDALRREIEKCDFVTCLLNMLSSSGGTGSGLGSRIIELIKEEYPSKFITNIVVLPFHKGDVVTQNYNTLLTLVKLYDITDNTILFENDKMYDISKRLVSNREIKLSDLNQIISQQIASVTQPVADAPFHRITSQISCHPSYKFIQIKTAPHFSFDYLKYESIPQWSTLTNQVLKSSKSDILLNNKLCKKVKYVGNFVLTRGCASKDDIDMKKFQDKAMYVSWVPDSEKVVHYGQQRKFMHYQKFVSLLTNNNNICNTLNYILEDAWNLFTHGAYLHHYKKYGVDDEYFLGAFQKLENILNDYKML